ncbi:hypothetical protein JD844_031683 [Phrynosoma platyrhinos]|uniref:Uncharacterized protein n=1 Tax=Phrynosoma platyrhinos TaxID=52577 RepID=A0ABQ7T424_PHRPL|nr:hypothetical protein JD844_031683 [Phrynosoma platyrhinos]
MKMQRLLGRSQETEQYIVAADPVIDRQTSSEQSDWCDNHNTIHRRLDTIQEIPAELKKMDEKHTCKAMYNPPK